MRFHHSHPECQDRWCMAIGVAMGDAVRETERQADQKSSRPKVQHQPDLAFCRCCRMQTFASCCAIAFERCHRQRWQASFESKDFLRTVSLKYSYLVVVSLFRLDWALWLGQVSCRTPAAQKTNRQTDRQASKQASKHASKQTNKQPNTQAN